jgi:hypothetical protein
MVSSHVRRQAECGNLFPRSRSLHRWPLTPRKDRKYVIASDQRAYGLVEERGDIKTDCFVSRNRDFLAMTG